MASNQGCPDPFKKLGVLGFLKNLKNFKSGNVRFLGFLFFKSKFLLFFKSKSVNLFEFIVVDIIS